MRGRKETDKETRTRERSERRGELGIGVCDRDANRKTKQEINRVGGGMSVGGKGTGKQTCKGERPGRGGTAPVICTVPINEIIKLPPPLRCPKA